MATIPTTTTTTMPVGMRAPRFRNRPSAEGCGLWTATEHAKFLRALEVYPRGPWRAVAAFVGTRNVRQTMTHAQKHKQKIARHERGLRSTATRRPSTEPTEPTTPTTPTMRRDGALPMTTSEMALFPIVLDDTAVYSSSTMTTTLDADWPLRIKLMGSCVDEDELVLATPVVADCLDYLVRFFAY